MLQQGFENLRHVHGRGHSDPVAARHGLAGGACSGSLEAAGEAGAGPGATGSGGGRGGSRRQPMGSTDPGPPVHPQLGHLPAQAAARPSLPRCLAGQTWPCASCNTWSHCTNHLTESLCCYLTLQREVLPQAGSHDQGLPGENREPAPCPRVCTAQSGTLDREALAQWRAGPAVGTSWGWDLRPWHCRQLSTKDKLCVHTHRHVKAPHTVTCRLVDLQGLCVCVLPCWCTCALQGTRVCMGHAELGLSTICRA